jgi:hypothetical protein
MTVPAAPLPDTACLVRALGANIAPEASPWLMGGSGRTAVFFSRGSMALAAASVALQAGTAGGQWQLWVPEYFCAEALAPLRHLGIPLRFYPVNEDLSPDLPQDLAGPGALVLVHYFGFPNTVDKVESACHNAGLTLIEDAAHVLVPHNGIGSSSWVVYSPRKLLALPAGGLLVLPGDNASHLPAALSPKAGESALWALRRLTQSMLRAARISWHKGPSAAAAASHSDPAVRECSSYTLNLLREAEGSLAEVVRRRQENYRQVASWTANLRGCTPLHPNLPNTVCPYVYPLRVSSAERVVRVLQDSGVPAFLWPDLPSESRGAVAKRLATEMVLLPVHQSLLPRELERIHAALERAAGAS